MGAIIHSLYLYANMGYTPGGREVPPVGTARVPDVRYSFFNVKCARTIHQVDLPLSYVDALPLTYLAARISTSPSVWIYGWITGIEQIAGVNDAVRLTWETDHWRTYSGDMVVRRGRIVRCPSTYTEYYSGCGTDVKPAVYSTVSEIDYLRAHAGAKPGDPMLQDNWILLQVITSGTTSSIEYWALPIIGAVYVSASERPDGVWRLSDIYGGRMDEILGISPQSIAGAWVIPFSPISHITLEYNVSMDGYLYHCDNPIMVQEPRIGGPAGYRRSWIKIHDPSYLGVPGNVSFSTDLGITDDTHSLVQLNQVGSIAWAAPYYPPLFDKGLKIYQSVKVSGTDCSILIIVTDAQDTIGISEQIRLGLSCEIPAVSVPISSNAWSEYLYSGTREFDIESQKAQNEAAMYKGMLGASNSALFGALAGTAIGNPIAGGIIGGIGQIIGSAIGGSVDESLRSDIQEMKDHYMSQQTNGLILPGGSNAWIWASFQEGIRFARLDPVNLDWDRDRDQYGHATDYAGTDIQLNGQTGPWQIQDAVITGDLPTESRIAIQRMLAKGVYIIERNG